MISKTKPFKWSAAGYVRIYQLACYRLSDKEIRQTLRISSGKWRERIRDDDSLVEVLEMARQRKSNSLADAFFARMPSNCRKLWTTKIMGGFVLHFEDRNVANEREKQFLYLYAYLLGNFSHSQARKFVNVTPRQFANWLEEETFQELVREIEFAKKDMVESALLDLVQMRDTKAVIFANQAINRDRGYAHRTEVGVTGNIEHQHNHNTVVNLEDLQLSPEQQRIMADALISAANAGNLERAPNGQKTTS